jgi:hypothetical protein
MGKSDGWSKANHVSPRGYGSSWSAFEQGPRPLTRGASEGAVSRPAYWETNGNAQNNVIDYCTVKPPQIAEAQHVGNRDQPTGKDVEAKAGARGNTDAITGAIAAVVIASVFVGVAFVVKKVGMPAVSRA